MSDTIAQVAGGYRFLPGIDAYSSGVIAEPGWEIVHVTLAKPLPWEAGLQAVRRYVEAAGSPVQAVCGVELRCPAPHTMDGFIEFNQRYRSVLESWDVLVDGEMPIARTNVAPVVGAPDETQLHAFSFTVKSPDAPGTYVVAGAGELPTRRLDSSRILQAGCTDAEAMQEKAACVVGILRHRMEKLQADAERISTIDVYTMHPLRPLLHNVIMPDLPRASQLGVQWFLSRPPIVEIEFEMDLRGVRREIIAPL